jgi:5-methylcytosine-specific restriction endonuclease McrA
MILVLNADYTPLGVTTLGRGFKLVYKGKAETILVDREFPEIAASVVFKRPSVIRLKRYISCPYKKVPLTRQNLYKRDGYSCTYCGGKKNLTIDHVVPRSRGGNNSWANLTTCCYECNSKKGDKTPEEANMVLQAKPFAPSHIHMFHGPEIKEDWKVFVFRL